MLRDISTIVNIMNYGKRENFFLALGVELSGLTHEISSHNPYPSLYVFSGRDKICIHKGNNVRNEIGRYFLNQTLGTFKFL